MAVACAVTTDGERLRAALTGRLGLRDVAPLYQRLLKCLAEQPDALLVDLAGLSVAEPLALAVFTATVRQAARWPGIPVLFCAPGRQTRALLDRAAYHRLPVFASTDAALTHAGDRRDSLRALSDELLPMPGAARQARDVATDACLRWDLPDLVAPASLIAGELVSNVVDHANTMATLRLSLRRLSLTIAVRDGSEAEPGTPRPVPPDAPTGRGLLLVEATAHSWGWLPSEGGKVVWASLAR